MLKDTKTAGYRRRLAELTDEIDNEGWKSHWVELRDWFLPRHGRYLNTDKQTQNDGAKKHQKIINGIAGRDIRICASGLQSGIANPTNPWFRITTADPDMNEYAPVKWWTSTVRDLMLNVYLRSNFYGSMLSIYTELPVFATSAMHIEEDFEQVIRCRPYTIGEYLLAINAQYRVDTLYRRFSLTTVQMVQMFGLDNVSQPVKEAWNDGKYGLRFEIVHAIQPNINVKSGRADVEGKPIESVYFEVSGDQDKILRRGGYKTLPFIAPRWETLGVSTYGNHCPGMNCLGDERMLQKMETKKLKGLDKAIDPPMTAPLSMKGKGGSIISGDITYIDKTQGSQGFEPTHQVNLDFKSIAFELDRVEKRIGSEFYRDLFLAVLNNEKEKTAFEIAKAYEEKLILLGPMLQKSQDEILDPSNNRTFGIMDDMGLLPPMPKEMIGMPLKLEYTSMLAQASKMVNVSSVTQLGQLTMSFAPIKPDVVDKYDFDEAIDSVADALGTPVKVVRSDEVVAKIREDRAAQATQQQQMAQMAALADPAKKAASAVKDIASANEDGAVDKFLAGMGAGQ